MGEQHIFDVTDTLICQGQAVRQQFLGLIVMALLGIAGSVLLLLLTLLCVVMFLVQIAVFVEAGRRRVSLELGHVEDDVQAVNRKPWFDAKARFSKETGIAGPGAWCKFGLTMR